MTQEKGHSPKMLWYNHDKHGLPHHGDGGLMPSVMSFVTGERRPLSGRETEGEQCLACGWRACRENPLRDLVRRIQHRHCHPIRDKQ